ncbi:DUF2591 domain-containing protein [Providencia rettgeri]|uniref:phage protein NinX family protein n=1 Tax=Providencia rettgeri TaxID=587 RepID=UPI001B39B130|nr:phage protein NinX family protein [Providencia rettgeri]EHZ7762391.1 DUF2591 family protein [Providencia rettgeri]EIJ7165533.1 DUF2591 family protein [Providencia rettgeri]MBQ0607184.1 DUF2591 family protein [Providencia rettgeri]MCJ2222211.1 DUF2591 domain-containing protein [Providencia rettgeri]MDY0820018.1 phage protein NinX family protein [Providencia rettgeri]
MNKYTELSDFEINMLIARVNDGIHIDDKRTAIDCYIHSQSSPSSVRVWDGDIGYLTFDFCNNPADAMPIIIENGISMVRVNNAWSARQFNNHCIEINGDNYYRIAMEVYLLMNGK